MRRRGGGGGFGCCAPYRTGAEVASDCMARSVAAAAAGACGQGRRTQFSQSYASAGQARPRHSGHRVHIGGLLIFKFSPYISQRANCLSRYLSVDYFHRNRTIIVPLCWLVVVRGRTLPLPARPEVNQGRKRTKALEATNPPTACIEYHSRP